MDLLRRLLREPLAHFLVLGAVLFAAYAMVSERDVLDEGERTIVVDRDALLNFLQYRSAAFEPEYFEAQLDALSDAQLAELARSYVREEAMAREARALGLDQNDYVIRRRLVQKIEFLVADARLEPEPPDEEELRTYFEQNQDEFREGLEFTFTHVFADAERDHPGGSEAEAQRLLAQLRSQGAGFNDAPRFGDRFPYQRNYVGESPRTITDQLGGEFVQALAGLEPGDRWYGPIASPYGHHLVMLSERKDPRVPEFEEVREQVLAAVLRERQARTRETLLDELVDQYEVSYEGVPAPEESETRS